MAMNPALVGRLLAGRYRLQQRRGSGAFGTVLDGFDEQLERAVVVRILVPQLVATPEAEARLAATMQEAASIRNPHLNAVHDWGIEEIEDVKVPYIVLELAPNGTLRDMLDRGRLLTPSQALVVGLEACRGLDALHRR